MDGQKSTFAVDKTEGIKQELNEMLRLQQMLISEIVGTSAVEEEKLQDYTQSRVVYTCRRSNFIKTC